MQSPAPESPDPQPQTGPPGEARRIELKYRAWNRAQPPRRIRMAIPGWAGELQPAEDGATPQPWHCRPFADASTYGIELVYAFETECRVTREDGAIRFDGDFSGEIARAAERGEKVEVPFGAFAPHHYGMTTAIDILPPPGHVLRVEPHPRFFTDTTGEVPAAVPGHIERFWPRMFFAVFKAPRPGETHVFRPGEPFAQLLVVPASAGYTLTPMEEEEAEERRTQEQQVSSLKWLLAKHIWRADSGLWFDDTYKQLQRIHRASGPDGVRTHLRTLAVLARMGGTGTDPRG
ncbi:MAG TPA: hypothetical protein VLK66_16580 [Longimicrobium sp.]|nr:hypothetical protein [Longimicrobium sp.]